MCKLRTSHDAGIFAAARWDRCQARLGWNKRKPWEPKCGGLCSRTSDLPTALARVGAAVGAEP